MPPATPTGGGGRTIANCGGTSHREPEPQEGAEHGGEDGNVDQVALHEIHETHVVAVPRAAVAVLEAAVTVVVLGEREHLVLVVEGEVLARDEERAGGDDDAKVGWHDEAQPPRVAVR